MNSIISPDIWTDIFRIAIGAIFTWVAAAYWYKRTEAGKMQGRLAELETKLALVNQAVIPISTAFQAILIKELTHFHTPEMDALMALVGPPNKLDHKQQARLAQLLDERMKDMGPLISDSERGAAKILPTVMQRAIDEQSLLDYAEGMKIKLVTVAAVVGVPNLDDEPPVFDRKEPPLPISVAPESGKTLTVVQSPGGKLESPEKDKP